MLLRVCAQITSAAKKSGLQFSRDAEISGLGDYLPLPSAVLLWLNESIASAVVQMFRANCVRLCCRNAAVASLCCIALHQLLRCRVFEMTGLGMFRANDGYVINR